MIFSGIVRNLIDAVEGKNLFNLISDIAYVSVPTLKKPIEQVHPNTHKRLNEKLISAAKRIRFEAGWTEDEVNEWIEQHPQSKGSAFILSSLVYTHQWIDRPYELTLAVAGDIDCFDEALGEAVRKNDLDAVKASLLAVEQLQPGCLNPLSNDGHELPSLREEIASASDAEAMEPYLNLVTTNLLLSFLAQWDIEFSNLFFPQLEPRQVFAMVFPRIHPDAIKGEDGHYEGRRDLFWLPVRRLIELIAVIGEYERRSSPRRVPKVKDIGARADVSMASLVSWRDGTKKLKGSDFRHLWHGLCTRRGETGPIPEPWPLYLAAMLADQYMVGRGENYSVVSIKRFDALYQHWWERHFKAWKASGRPVGEKPWPILFNEI